MLYIPKIHTHKENCEYFKHLINTDTLFVALVDNQLSGFIGIESGWVNHLYIHSNFQNQGVGKALLDFAKKMYPNELQLWVFEDNKNAIRFYEREGFVLDLKRDALQTDNEENLPDRRYLWKGI
jgi:GNAT superfamily N-acetyltransferase